MANADVFTAFHEGVRLSRFVLSATIAGGLLLPAGAAAQTVLDRVDPARIEAKMPPEDQPAADVPVAVPQSVATPATATAPITVGAITLSGLEVLRAADFADVFERYVGRTLSPAALAELADAIAARARARGFVFATAGIAPQTITAGVLRVTVDEGRIDEVRLRGDDNAAVRAALAPLVGAGPVTLDQVERRLLIAGDVDGLWLRRTRFLREGTRNVLLVEVGANPVTAIIGLDNYGSRPIGPIMLNGTIRVSQLLAPDDLLTVSASTVPTRPREYVYGRVRYAKRVSHQGTELSASVTHSNTHPGSYLRSRDIAGRSWTGTLGVLHPVIRSRETSLWFEGSFGVRSVKQDRRGVLARRDRLSVARVGAYGFSTVAGGRLRVNATLSQGLDVFDATGRGDPLASRGDADGTFTTLSLWSDWTGPLVGDLSAHVAVASQIAAQPVLISEEAGLGGGAFLRGYDYSERSGDQGAMASGELRYTIVPKLGPVTDPQLYTFVDGGRVTNLNDGFGTGTLFSAGAGVRSTIARTITADAGIAVPLSGRRYDSGTADPVVNFRLTKRF